MEPVEMHCGKCQIPAATYPLLISEAEWRRGWEEVNRLFIAADKKRRGIK